MFLFFKPFEFFRARIKQGTLFEHNMNMVIKKETEKLNNDINILVDSYVDMLEEGFFDNLKKKLDGWDGYRKSSGLAYLYKTKIIINSIYLKSFISILF